VFLVLDDSLSCIFKKDLDTLLDSVYGLVAALGRTALVEVLRGFEHIQAFKRCNKVAPLRNFCRVAASPDPVYAFTHAAERSRKHGGSALWMSTDRSNG